MSIEDIPRVSFEEGNSMKFVQIRGPQHENYVYAARRQFHDDVFTNFLGRVYDHGLNPLDYRVVGGGILQLDAENKMLSAEGSSLNYGKFDATVVKSLLESYVQEHLEGYRVNIE